MLSPCLVHFPDRESRIVMKVDDAVPRAGDELINGWLVERQAPAGMGVSDYEHEVWVKPKPSPAYGRAA
jgi:hypothetical protein